MLKKASLISLFCLIFVNVNARWNCFYPSISDVQFIGTNWGIAIGDAGLIMEFDGTNWNKVPVETDENFISMDFISVGEGWIGSVEGNLYHYSNGELNMVYQTTQSAIIAIDMYDSNLGYMSQGSKIYKFNGSTWEEEYFSQPFYIRKIFINDLDDIWAVGLGGMVLRYNGTLWNTININTEEDLNSIFFNNGSGYIISNFNCYFYDGFSWNKINGGGGYDIWADNVTNIWTTSTNYINHFDGSSWNSTLLSSSITNKSIYCIDLFNTNNGWALGENMSIIKINNGILELYYCMPTLNDLNSVFFNDINDGWAVGNNGTILHYNGIDWNIVNSPTDENLNSVYFTSNNDGWAVGKNACILHYCDNEWTLFESPVTTNWYSVNFSNSLNGWITGFNTMNECYTLKYNDESWEVNNNKGGLSVYTYDINNTWISTVEKLSYYYGRLYKYVSGIWMENEIPEGLYPNQYYNIYDIDFINPSIGFAVSNESLNNLKGSKSRIYSFRSESGWSLDLELQIGDLNTIDAIDENNCWVGGHFLTINKWNGADWWSPQHASSGYSCREFNIYDINMLNNDLGWFVGEDGAIFWTKNGGVPENYHNGINNPLLDFETINISPNPASTFINIIGFKESDIVDVSIYTLNGVLVLRKNFCGNEIYVDLSSIENGFYICHITTKFNKQTKKIIKI